MRDKRFVAAHRGGLLTKKQHHQLTHWAHDCTQHVLNKLIIIPDPRLTLALAVVLAWEKDEVTLSETGQASLEAFDLADSSADPILVAIARAAGHLAAAPQMADQALKAVSYALKAVTASGQTVESEKKWQDDHIPLGIIELVHSSRLKF